MCPFCLALRIDRPRWSLNLLCTDGDSESTPEVIDVDVPDAADSDVLPMLLFNPMFSLGDNGDDDGVDGVGDAGDDDDDDAMLLDMATPAEGPTELVCGDDGVTVDNWSWINII